MREVEKVFVEYVGYRQPDTLDELELEILGLKTAIAAAHARVASLEQSKQLFFMRGKDAQTVEAGPDSDEAQQESGAGLEQTGSGDEGEG